MKFCNINCGISRSVKIIFILLFMFLKLIPVSVCCGAIDGNESSISKKACKNSSVEDLYQKEIILELNLEDTVFIANKKCSADKIILSLPKTMENFDIRSIKNWQYLLIDILTGDTIQFSYNYFPEPKYGKMGNKKKDGYKDSDVGNVNVLKPMKVGRYQLIRFFDLNTGEHITINQNIIIKDVIAPIPVLVDIASVVMKEGKVELKARWFDKGGCGKDCIASFDNCGGKEQLIFTFTSMLPDIESNPVEFGTQIINSGRVFFDPKDGSIMTEADYNNGTAHAFYSSENTTSRLFLAHKMNKEITQYEITIFVWDEFSIDESFGDRNYSYKEVSINFQF